MVAKDFFSWCVWVGHFQMPQQRCYTYIATVSQLFWCRSYQLSGEDFLLWHWGCHLWHRAINETARRPANCRIRHDGAWDNFYLMLRARMKSLLMWRAEKVQIILGFQNSQNWKDISPSLNLRGTNDSNHSDSRADLLLPWKELIICYCALRCIEMIALQGFWGISWIPFLTGDRVYPYPFSCTGLLKLS